MDVARTCICIDPRAEVPIESLRLRHLSHEVLPLLGVLLQ